MNYYYYQDAEVREQIDELLQQNATIQANLGTDSTTEEREEAKRKWMELAKQIREIDPKFYRERIMAQHR
jgi:antitoxin component of MazEF toxin-antitoxin module